MADIENYDENARVRSRHFEDSDHTDHTHVPRDVYGQDSYRDNDNVHTSQHLYDDSHDYHDPYAPENGTHDYSSRFADQESARDWPNDPKRRSDLASSSSLVNNAADISGAPVDPVQKQKSSEYQDFEFSDAPRTQKAPFAQFMGSGRYPLEQRIEDKRRGIGRQKYPFVVWILTAIMVAVIIYELVRNFQAQGTPISTKPVFNPMIGPSQSALINFGARYPPCMKEVTGIPIDIQFGCLNNTATPPTSLCPLEDICGFGGFHNQTPNQWFRFITPIFIHAGLIHIALNMFAQLLISAQVEKEMGSGGFVVLYFSAGIFGNVLGGNFALAGLPSVGASGAIFGTVATTWIDLFTHWRYKYRPVRQLMINLVELLVGIGLGYIPGVDNFAHLGGFFMGLIVSTVFYPVVSVTKKHKLIVWGFRIVAAPIAIVLFVILIRNFYTGDPYSACSGCRYLSCIPTNSNNHCQGNGISVTSSTGSTSL